MVSETPLHNFIIEEYERKSFDPNAKGLAGLEWDSAELFKVNWFG